MEVKVTAPIKRMYFKLPRTLPYPPNRSIAFSPVEARSGRVSLPNIITAREYNNNPAEAIKKAVVYEEAATNPPMDGPRAMPVLFAIRKRE